MVTALLVTSGATLLESMPFILAAAVLPVPLRWSSRTVPYLGCGCGAGPSARSLPAAAATCLVFGPLVAVARLAAAIAVARFMPRAAACEARDATVLTQLYAIAPVAGIGASVAFFAPTIFGTHVPSITAFASGALAAFIMAPCALGTVGFAAAMRSWVPGAAVGYLCIAGILDLRTWMRASHPAVRHDALAYALAAIACALVAARGGAGVIHPKIALALWPCAVACGFFAYRFRYEYNALLRIAPVVMLAGAVLSAPPPEYHATETTLADAFTGERIDFTGLVTHTGDITTLVRYAITCCRADAAPIVLRLLIASPAVHGWMRARGVLIEGPDGLSLRADQLQAIPAPIDPFVYR